MLVVVVVIVEAVVVLLVVCVENVYMVESHYTNLVTH